MYSWFGIIYALIGGITPKELLIFPYIDIIIIIIYKILKRLGLRWNF